MPKTIIQNVKLPISQVEALRTLSNQTGICRHRLMKQAITEFLIKRTLSEVKKSS